MNSLFLLLSSATGALAPSSQGEAIVVTAARQPVAIESAPVSATLIEADQLEALALPHAADLLRLVPAIAVAVAGPPGSQAQLRIRGAEANHTLLFVDGIRFNDPAAGNEARFELLAADTLSRIEVVRGPQSALWGSEALGGVVAVDTADPLRRTGLSALGEYGGNDSSRLAAQTAFRVGGLGLAASAGWLRSEGIDALGREGERDGFDTRTISLKAVYAPSAGRQLGLVGHRVEGRSDFDGFDPLTFRRADTLDATDNAIHAVRGWGSAEFGDWSARADASFLESANRNRLAADPLNSSFGRRLTAGGQLSRRIGGHDFIGAVEHEKEDFRARDTAFFGGTDQDRSRSLTALVGQWRAAWAPFLLTDLAVRRDVFSAFADATTVRAAALARPLPAWTIHVAYGEGIAQPTFYDLFGFFPGSFVGNPVLRPEWSRGWEAGLGWRSGPLAISATAFTNRLEDEILDVFDPVTFQSTTANAEGRSRRRGLELEAQYQLRFLRIGANYSWLDAGEQRNAGDALVREVRRPRHSANLTADGLAGPLIWGASIAYVGERTDLDFDEWPARTVILRNYLLASFRVGWRLTPALEAYGRVENAFDADYQDVVGYQTPGRTVYAGIRLRLGR